MKNQQMTKNGGREEPIDQNHACIKFQNQSFFFFFFLLEESLLESCEEELEFALAVSCFELPVCASLTCAGGCGGAGAPVCGIAGEGCVTGELVLLAG